MKAQLNPLSLRLYTQNDSKIYYNIKNIFSTETMKIIVIETRQLGKKKQYLRKEHKTKKGI